jgi:hypothetical protein
MLLLLMPLLLMPIELIGMLESLKEDLLGSDIDIFFLFSVPSDIDEFRKKLKNDDIFKQPYVIPEYEGKHRKGSHGSDPKQLDEAWQNIEVEGLHFAACASASASCAGKESLEPYYRTTVVNISEEKHS